MSYPIGVWCLFPAGVLTSTVPHPHSALITATDRWLQTLTSKCVSETCYVSYWVDQKACLVFSIKQNTYIFSSPITLLIWIFCDCWRSPSWCNTYCSQLMSSFDLYELHLVYPTIEHRPVMKSPPWKFENHFWHSQSVTAPSSHTAKIPFAFQ